MVSKGLGIGRMDGCVPRLDKFIYAPIHMNTVSGWEHRLLSLHCKGCGAGRCGVSGHSHMILKFLTLASR